MHSGFHHLIVSNARQHGDAPAVLSRDGECITHAELLERTRRLQQGLLRLGAEPSDRIASLIPDGPRIAEVALGVSSVSIYAPLNASAPAEELERTIRELRPRWVLTPEAGIDYGVPALRLDEVVAAAGDAGFQVPREDRVAIILHTSGTTANAKRVQVKLSMYGYGYETLLNCFALTPHDRHFTVIPQFHSLGIVSGVLAPVLTGGSVVLCPGFDRQRFEEDWERAKPTWFAATPAILRALADLEPHLQSRLTSPRFLRSAAAPLPEAVVNTVERMFGARILQTYGMTEAICVTMETPSHFKHGSVGRVTAGELRIAGGSTGTVSPGERGLVILRGANITAGYENNDEANREAFDNGWLVTGDEGYLDGEGYLFLTGRFKEFINRGGQKVNPSEVDEVLQQHPGVRRAATFAIPDERLGEETAAAVSLMPSVSLTECELQEFAAERLALYKVPRRILIVDNIPISATGKFQRRKLAEHYAPELARRTEHCVKQPAGSLNTVQTQILALFREIVRSDNVTHADNFFDHCDSLQAVQLLAAIEQKLDIPAIPSPVLWRAPNVLALAEYLSANATQPRDTHFYPIERGGDLPPIVFISPEPNYANIWRSMKGSAPMFGLELPDSLFVRADTSIEGVASWCADQIEQANLPGKFAIAGWCMTGVVAFETARQLLARGIGPVSVVMFDSHDILSVPGDGLRKKIAVASRNLDRIRFHSVRLVKDKNFARYFSNRLSGLATRLNRWQQERAGEPAQGAEEVQSKVCAGFSRAHTRVLSYTSWPRFVRADSFGIRNASGARMLPAHTVGTRFRAIITRCSEWPGPKLSLRFSNPCCFHQATLALSRFCPIHREPAWDRRRRARASNVAGDHERSDGSCPLPIRLPQKSSSTLMHGTRCRRTFRRRYTPPHHLNQSRDGCPLYAAF